MKLHSIQLGSGQPLIILHGLFGSLDNWMTLAKAWSTQFKVVLVDQRNHGRSPHSAEFSYSLMADDLHELIEDKELDQPIILGHSMGGKTAMEFAVNYPELLDKLVVVDIAPVKYQVHHYAILEALHSVDLNQIQSRKEADALLQAKIPEMGVRQFLLKNLYWSESKKLAWRFNLETIDREIIPISEFDISYSSFEGPTLFIKGEKSDYIMEEYDGLIEPKFPNYKRTTIEDAGHWIHAEKRDAFTAVVNDFIGFRS